MINEKNLKNNSEIAEILGCFIGDGWIENRGDALYIAGNPREDKDHYDNVIAPIFSKYFIKVIPRNFSYWGVYGIVSYKKEIISKAIPLGFQKGKKSHVAKIPEYVMNSKNHDLWKSVLRGIFDTDGCFYCKKEYGKYNTEFSKKHHTTPRIKIGLVSKELIDQIGFLLNKLNIEFKKTHQKEGFICNKNCSSLYILNIWKNHSIDLWFKNIGSSNQRQITRYAIWKKYGFLPPYTNLVQRKLILDGTINPYSFYKKEI